MKYVNHIVVFSFVACILILVYIGGLVYEEHFPINPADFHADQIIIQTPKVQAGGELHYSIPVEKFGVYPATISGTLISRDRKTAYALKGETGALPVGNYEALNQEVDIPKRVNPDFYSYSRIYLYQVGRRTVIKNYETPLFEVIP